MIQKKLLSDNETDQMQTDARVAELEYDVTNKSVQRLKTVSPIDGVIVARKTAPGEFVGTDPVFEMVSLDPLNVELVMKVDVYGQMKMGMPVRLALGPPVNAIRTGTVSIVDRVVDARSGTFGVRVQLDNADMLIPSGIACEPRFGNVPIPRVSSSGPAR
jgi:multidrug efflux pump subunit AcrA (membrane-fusion protein)